MEGGECRKLHAGGGRRGGPRVLPGPPVACTLDTRTDERGRMRLCALEAAVGQTDQPIRRVRVCVYVCVRGGALL